ncbi:MAG: hypothetical protein ACFFCW_09355 [Candidatus Hodarchaeota archaeon]
MDDKKRNELREAEKLAGKSAESLLGVAKDIAKAGDRGWAREICQKAVSKAKGWRDSKSIAEAIADKCFIGDLDWAREVYMMAANQAREIRPSTCAVMFLHEIADSIMNKLNDKKSAKEVYKLLIDKEMNNEELRNIAESIADEANFDDKEWAREVYKRAIEMDCRSEDLIKIGYSIECTLNDMTWAREVYKLAIEKAKGPEELRDIVESIAQEASSEDMEWARNAYETAISNAQDSESLCAIAELIVNTLGDKQWAKEVYQLAIDKAETEEDETLYTISELIAEQLGDEEWAQKVYKMAAGEDVLKSLVGETVDLEKAKKNGYIYNDKSYDNPVLIKYLTYFQLEGIYDKYGFDNYSVWVFIDGEKIVDIQRIGHCMESFYEQERFRWMDMEYEAHHVIAEILK